MKILYCIHSLHHAGGMERVLTFKANYLADRLGHEVCIVASDLCSRKPFFPLGGRVKCIDLHTNDNLFPLRHARLLRRVVMEERPDLCVSLGGRDVNSLVRCNDGSPKIVEYHFAHDKFFLKYKCAAYAKLRSRKLFRKFFSYDELVVLSGYDAAYFRELAPLFGKSPDMISVIGNPLTISSPLRSSLEEKRFISVGRLSPEKGFDDALKIWKKVSCVYPDWKLDIFGAGPMKESLAARIESLGLGDCVCLKGNSPEISKEYASASGILITSRYEGFPLVAVEASNSGLPAVAFECPGGLPEIIRNDENGFIVPKGDIDAAAEKVCALIGDYALRKRMGENAVGASEKFSPENIMAGWVALFERAITSRNGI